MKNDYEIICNNGARIAVRLSRVKYSRAYYIKHREHILAKLLPKRRALRAAKNEVNAMKIAGKLVEDSQEPLSFTIIEKDAALGNIKDPGGCAAARAIVRSIPNAKAARIHLACSYVEFSDKWVRYLTPGSLRGEIISFDRGLKQYSPGMYTLRPVHASQRIKKDMPVKGKRKYRKLTPYRHRVTDVRKTKRYFRVGGVRARGANI